MTKLSLIVKTSPFSCPDSAYSFAKTALELGYGIEKVFFYGDGAITANKLLDYPEGETPIGVLWQELKNTYTDKLDLVVCKNSSLRRGVNQDICLDGFKLGSMAELVEIDSKVVVFK